MQLHTGVPRGLQRRVNASSNRNDLGAAHAGALETLLSVVRLLAGLERTDDRLAARCRTRADVRGDRARQSPLRQRSRACRSETTPPRCRIVRRLVSRAGLPARPSAARTPRPTARLPAELPAGRATWPLVEGAERWPHQTVRHRGLGARSPGGSGVAAEGAACGSGEVAARRPYQTATNATSASDAAISTYFGPCRGAAGTSAETGSSAAKVARDSPVGAADRDSEGAATQKECSGFGCLAGAATLHSRPGASPAIQAPGRRRPC